MKARRLFALFSFVLLTTLSSFSQPNWYGGTPIVTPHVLSGDFQYGIDQVGKVYVFMENFNDPTIYSSATVKTAALAATNSFKISVWVLNVPSGSENNVFTISNFMDQFNGNISLLPNHDYTLYFVAEDGSSNLQAASVRIVMTTLPCPSIYVATGFDNTQKCVNGAGASKIYTISTYSGYSGQYSNVLNGASWSINWGDGSPNFIYTSTYDNDGPGGVLIPGWEYDAITHPYTQHDSCYKTATLKITNPGACATVGSLVETKQAVLAGRDWDPDGNGSQLVVNNANGSPDTIKICEGTATNIVLRDAGVWDCDQLFKTYPPGEIDAGNRNVQYVYGEDPVSQLVTGHNTITGDVSITGTYNGTANTTAGFASGIINIPVPSPVTNPHTLSDVITIPATAVYGQYMHVYFKDWNKCNPWTGIANTWDGSAVWDSIVIYIVRTPAAPTVTSPQNYCFGSVPATISATPHTGGNTIKWYSDAGLTNLLGTGTSYTHGKTAVGTYNFWATETNSADLCNSPASQITLNINPLPTAGITPAAPPQQCPGLTLNYNGNPAAGTPPFTHAWTGSGSANLSAINIVNPVYTAPSPGVQTTYGLTYTVTDSKGCTAADTKSVIVNPSIPVSVSIAASANPVCSGTSVTFTATPTNGGAPSYQWKLNGGNVGTNSSTYTNSTLVNADQVNCVMTSSLTPCATNNPATSNTVTMTINPNPTLTGASQASTVCAGSTATINLTGLLASSTSTVSYKINGVAQTPVAGVVANGAGSASFTSAALTAANNGQILQITGITVTSAAPNCSGVFAQNVTMSVSATSVGGTVSSNQTICYNTQPANLTLAGQTGNVVKWQYASDAAFTVPNYIAVAATTLPGATIGNLTTNTYFRAVVQSGVCPTANSSSILVTINPLPTLTGAAQSATVCAGSGATINLTGLLASSTSTVAYTINAVVQTPVAGVVANGSGAASFTSAALTAANNGQILQITGITVTSAAPNCSQIFTQNVTLSVNPLPTLTGASQASTVCAGSTATINLTGLLASSTSTVSYTINGTTADPGCRSSGHR